MRGEDKSSCLKKTDLLFCTTFSSCNMCLLRFIQYLSYLSLSCTLSLFFYLSPSLSLFGHSDVRFTASLTGAAGEFPSAVWSLIPPNLSFCSLCALRLKTTRFLRLWLFFFFLKSSATLNPKSSSSCIASEDEAGPFLRNGFKRCTLLFCKLHFVQDSIHNSIANNKLSTFLYVFQLCRSTGID